MQSYKTIGVNAMVTLNKIKSIYFRKFIYSRKLKPCYFEPYPIDYYQRLIGKLSETQESIIHPFTENIIHINNNKSHIYIRHDIDTYECIRKMSYVLDTDLEYKIYPGVYLRADEEEYNLKSFRNLIWDYKQAGIEIGIHTICYKEEDYFSELERECKVFSDELGFQPISLSVHGLGLFRNDVRQRFYNEMKFRLDQFGLEFADIPGIRNYDYVIEDCHKFKGESNRFIGHDFNNPFRYFFLSGIFLILTHPCYWTK